MKEKRGPRGPYQKKPLAERFGALWKRNAHGCHIWQGHINHNGYGAMGDGNVRDGYVTILAHRVAWTLKHGPIPEGLFVLHKCDVRPCVNAEHLFLGTLAVNMSDCVAKGRNRNGRLAGEQHGMAILTEKQVLAMRRERRRGVLVRELASKYGVSMAVAWRASTGHSWKHLNSKEKD